VAVIASGPGDADYTLPAGPTCEDLFGNPLKPGTAYGGTLVYATGNTAAELADALK
jgi:hypothetical protein